MSSGKRSIKDVPLANDRIIAEVAALHDIPLMQMRNEIEFIGRYIAAVIAKGTMEGVMIPNFGKFRPKEKMVRALALKEQKGEADNLYRAMKNKNLINNATIRSGRERPGETEQGMDTPGAGTGSDPVEG